MEFEYKGLERILEYLEISDLNDMQKACITACRTHPNVQLLSPTGSGKTLAFLLSLLERLDAGNTATTQAMIIVPSRELAQQIDQVFRSLRTGLKLTLCYGGHKREIEDNNLIQPPAVIIGTPGRLGDHIRRNNITTASIHTLILDEFDKALEAGFQEEVQFITDSLTAVQQRILTSATTAVPVPEFLNFDPSVTITFLPEAPGEKQALDLKYVVSEDTLKAQTIVKLICHLGSRPTIIFCNQRDSVELVSQAIKDLGIPCVYYHGQMEQRDRDAALCKFRNGTSLILVTTDIAARGLDIPHIRYIIHYNLPPNEESFIHRNGRTARMEASGTAILVLSPKEYLPPYTADSDIEKITLADDYTLPDKPKWVTLYMPLGKKNKISKGDIAGFLINQGKMRAEDIGIIEVKDFSAFIAVRRTKATHLIHETREARIKNKKAKLEFAK